MNLIDRIGMSTCRCGLCNFKDCPCDSCIERTLARNGLAKKLKVELQRISDRDISHAWAEYSPFKIKLKRLIKKFNPPH